MNDYEKKLNNLIKKKKLKKEELIRLLNEFKVKQSQEQVIELLKKDKLTKQDLLNLFKQEKIKKFKFKFPKINELFIIKIILTLMLITSIVIEMNYNIENFILMMGQLKGILTGVALVLYDCIAVSLIIFVIRIKSKGNFLKLLITKLFVSIVLFSLFIGVFYTLQVNIMNGLFNKFQDQLFHKKEQFENKELTLLERYEKQEKELEKEIDLRIDNRDFVQSKFRLVEDIKSKEYRNLNWRLYELNKEIDKRKKELNKTRNLIEKIIKENKVIVKEKKTTFFELVSLNIFNNKIKSNWLQIFQVFFPALIFNLISSSSMGLLLFLRKEN